ncbi:MAG: FG-GAP repeat protein [Chitinophagaceae bacterium]|nr:FG-GAP repeat protein [Chitinophagaceae bacterium]
MAAQQVYQLHNSTPDDANQANANFGRSVACAGDVNGDGYSDVIIGASGYDDGVNTNEGWAFVYYGSASGLSASPNNTLDDADQANANFGYCVSGAGDVNGDGYSDVIIGAWRYVDGANNQEGRAFVYHGSAGGLSLIPDNTPDDANQAFAWFGYSVAGAGDVNGDGYSDVIIGAYGFNDGANTQEGRAYIYYGSFSGLGSAPNNISDDADQAGAMFGWCVACAGDVNGDGFCDVIIGAPYYNDGINDDEGRAFVYYGSASGLSASPNSTPDDADQGLASFGISVASAGDVNGDGYSDVIIGAFLCDDGANSDEGRCFIYYGSTSGLSATPGDVQDDANQANSEFGYSVASAGDVNGDGYSDVIIGAYSYDDGATLNEGRCFVYYGNNGGGLRHNLRLYNTDLITPIQRFNITEPNLFGTGVFAKSPLGRVKAKLVWEVKQQGQPFSGSPITNSNAFLGKQPSFTNLGIGGTELKYNVQKTGQQNKVRVRVEYDKATAITGQVYGPWSYPAAYVQGAHGMNSIPLPVGLNLFEAALIAEKVELQWSSGHDDNIKNYKVERSSNNRDFMAVRNISSLHQNNKTYYYQDVDPLNGISWYRLAIINEQDQISYSKTIVIKNMNNSILIYPTILKNDENINLQFNKNIRGHLETQLVNIKGETVFKKYINTNWRRYTLDLPALPSGAYILTVGNKEDKIITQKIVIQ